MERVPKVSDSRREGREAMEVVRGEVGLGAGRAEGV